MQNKYTKEQICCIWLDSFLGLEYKYKFNLVNLIDLDAQSFNLPSNREYLTSMLGESVYSTLLSSANKVYLDYVLESLEKRNVTAITYYSENYPSSLMQTEIPPFVLYAKGDLELLDEQNVLGIVGSRKSLPLSLKLAQCYAQSMIDANFTLITGTADGVDGEVLKTALKSNAKAISVVAGGFDHVYPSTNKDLVEKVAQNGLIISEYPPDTIAKPFHFPVRNRIISALAKGVLIVSGGLKSGTLHTANYAIEYGKDLFAIPYSVGVQSGAGCNDLIKKGALLTDTPQDILDFYNIEQTKKVIAVTPQEKEVLSALKDGEQHVEKLGEILNKRVYELMPILSVLEIKGLVTKSGNVFGLTGNYSED